MNKNRFFAVFLRSLAATLFVGLSLHLLWRHQTGQVLFGDQLGMSYAMNFLLALVIVGLLFKYRLRIKHQVGFLFMAGSLIKFLLFFILLYPEYTQDHKIQTTEFAAFFIPYTLALTIETISAAKLLQLLERDDLTSDSK